MYFEKQLNHHLTLTEVKGRLKPAIIYMKRGTIIEADHARMVRTDYGTEMLVAGLRPGIFKETLASNISLTTGPFVRKLRDFVRFDGYHPTKWQDETGWDEPSDSDNPLSYYSAHRNQRWILLFQKIMTMNPANIDRIVWR